MGVPTSSARISRATLLKMAWVGLLATLGMALTVPAMAMADSVRFNISAQPLPQALKAFAAQAHMQLLYQYSTVANLRSNAVVGDIDKHTALEQLLKNSGLEVIYSSESAATIRPKQKPTSSIRSEDSQSGGGTDASQPNGSSLQLAQATPGASQGDIPVVKDDETTQTKPKDQALQEVVVVGSHIRGIANDTSPITVLDKPYIDSTGASNTAELVALLPQNFSLINQSSGINIPGVSANLEQGASIDLRGMGEGTTLVLLNGHRMAPSDLGQAVDISAIPLSAVKRVEVLTDGASAIYGSDAIGGVVNFVLQDEYQGAETTARIGYAPGGIDENRFSQTVGDAWGSGNALLSLNYYGRDLLSAGQREWVPSTSLVGSLLPRDKDYSGLFSGRQRIADDVSIFADALYTKRDTFNEGGRTSLNETYTSTIPQTTATVGIDWSVGAGWRLEGSGSYAGNRVDTTAHDDLYGSALGNGIYTQSHSQIRSIQLTADGPIVRLPAGTINAAIGTEVRSESFLLEDHFLSGPLLVSEGIAQKVHSVFAEALVPLLGGPNQLTGTQRLELSLAGRFDDYSNFGSHFDPKVGVLWQPLLGLRLRGTYGTSYKAPSLNDFSTAGNQGLAVAGQPDPGVPNGLSNQLLIYGSDAGGLTAQESRSFSIGPDWTPSFAKGFRLKLNYYSIHYDNQIATPPIDQTVILGNPAVYGGLIVRNPTLGQVEQYIGYANLGTGLLCFDMNFNQYPCAQLNPSAVNVIVDQRRRNLSVTETNGLDLSTKYDSSIGGNGVHAGFDATYVFKLTNEITADAPSIDVVNTIYNLPRLRLRAAAGWDRGGWAANVFVNYTGSYTDNRVPAMPISVSSWTTVDMRVGYSFKSAHPGGPLAGLTVAASAQNLFNANPPHTAALTPFDTGFDPTNANPLGRLAALDVTYQW